MRSRCSLLVVTRSDREDLIQATLAEALRSESSYDYNRPLLPWLNAIARRQAWIQGRARHTDGHPQSCSEAFLDPGELLERSHFSNELLLGLRSLTASQRRALFPQVIEERSASEVAALLGATPAAVESLRRRALVHLRRVLVRGPCPGTTPFRSPSPFHTTHPTCPPIRAWGPGRNHDRGRPPRPPSLIGPRRG
jgi:RNA polymerase sigma factor (sigma-70 family)